MSEIIKVPAIGVSITANVDGDRQVVFQTAIDPAEGDSAINGLLDRLMDFASRQKLIHDIVAMYKELKQLSLDATSFELRSSETTRNCAVANAQLDIQVMDWVREAKKLHDDAYQVWANNEGRRGTFIPRGSTAQDIARREQLVADAREQKRKNEEGRDAELANNEVNVKRRLERIEELKADIAKAEAKVAL